MFEDERDNPLWVVVGLDEKRVYKDQVQANVFLDEQKSLLTRDFNDDYTWWERYGQGKWEPPTFIEEEGLRVHADMKIMLKKAFVFASEIETLTIGIGKFILNDV